MQRLEASLERLMDRGYDLDVDTLIAQLEVRLNEESADSAPLARAAGQPVGLQRRRALLVGAAAFALVLAGAVPLLLASRGGSQAPVGTSPAPTLAPAVPDPNVAPVDPTPVPPEVGDEEPGTPTTIDAAPEPSSFGYASVGTLSGASTTSLGELTWYHSSRVPLEWIEAGFPGPSFNYPKEFLVLHEQRTLDGVIYEVGSGYLGLGAGAETREILMDWPGSMNNSWFAPWYSFVFVTEVWSSADGVEWGLMAENPFEPGAAVMHDPFAIAEHHGRWLLIGWVGVPDDDRYERDQDLAVRAPVPGSATPAAWVSDDLRSWTRVEFDFDVEGAYTALSSVAVSDRGWVIGGVRTTIDSPIRSEWAMWTSVDGFEWQEVAVAEVFDQPACRPTPNRFCNRLVVKPVDDAVAAYGWIWDDVPGDFTIKNQRWALWMGEFAEAGAD